MKDLKHIKRFNEAQENLNISDVSESKKLSSWELNSKIEKIINSNTKEIPYEGTEVDIQGIRDSILELIYELCPEYRPEGYGNKSPW
jgi:hypothetical protein